MLLGALQGPAELLPVSSSGHLALVPRLLGWPYADLPGDVRKSFEVAAHAGSALALAIALRRDLAALRPRDALPLALTLAPPAVAGLLLEGPIERRLGGVRAVAAAQVIAGAALWLADRRGGGRGAPEARDHLAAGLGQALALAPGVSRSGAALTATRWRDLDRPAAFRLSLRAALPVTLAAVGLKTARALGGGGEPLPRELRLPFVAGAAAAFATTAATAGLLGRVEGARSYGPFAAYRIGLGLAALAQDLRLNGPHA